MNQIGILEDAGSYRVFSEQETDSSSALDWPYFCALYLLRFPFDDAISEFLSHIGQAAEADRAWMIDYSDDLLRFRNSHEWCRGQVQAFIAELQETPTTLIGWLHRFMQQRQAVMISDVRQLPRTAHKLQVEFLRQHNKSVLSVPIFHDGKLRGLVGFDTTIAHKGWSAAEINALFQCANLIAAARFGSVSSSASLTRSEPDSAALVYLSKRGVVRGVVPEQIVGVRSAGNYSEIWLDDGSMLLDSRALGVWMSILPAKTFMRIHRTAFINLLHVGDIDRRKSDKWQVQLRHLHQSWPVSRAYRRSLRERMGI